MRMEWETTASRYVDTSRTSNDVVLRIITITTFYDVTSYVVYLAFLLQPSLDQIAVKFVDESDPDFERKELEQEISAKAEKGHWKAAVRKLKKLTRRFPDYQIPESVHVQTLEACMADRVQGARASEPARKIMEQMVELGYKIPEQAGNYCSKYLRREVTSHFQHSYVLIMACLILVPNFYFVSQELSGIRPRLDPPGVWRT